MSGTALRNILAMRLRERDVVRIAAALRSEHARRDTTLVLV